MQNPAYELAEIFEGWEIPPRAIPIHARNNYAESIGETPEQVTNRAMRCLVEIIQRVDQLERVHGMVDIAAMRHGIPSWQAGVLSVGNPLAGPAANGRRPAVSPDSMVQLRLLGSVLDSYGAALQPTPDARSRVEGALDQAQSAIEDLDISDSLRHHLLGLLARIREALAAGHPGEFASAVAEFVGTLHLYEQTENDPEKRSKWQKIRDDFLVPVAAGAVGNMLSSGVLLLGGAASAG